MAQRHGRHGITDRRKKRIENVLHARQPDLTLVMENIHDPHNLSAVMRSADAVGILHVHLLYHGGQEMPELKRSSSAGAHKWLEVHTHTSVDECFGALRRRNMKIYTTHLQEDAVSIFELDLTKPVALVFGNEHSGVSAEAAGKADGNVLIPQSGMIESLNISVACAVSVFEAFRQREAAGMYEESRLSPARLEELRAKWYKK